MKGGTQLLQDKFNTILFNNQIYIIHNDTNLDKIKSIEDIENDTANLSSQAILAHNILNIKTHLFDINDFFKIIKEVCKYKDFKSWISTTFNLEIEHPWIRYMGDIKNFINDINIPLYTILYNLDDDNDIHVMILTRLFLLFYLKIIIGKLSNDIIIHYDFINTIIYDNITEIININNDKILIINNNDKIELELKFIKNIYFSPQFKFKILIDTINTNYSQSNIYLDINSYFYNVINNNPLNKFTKFTLSDKYIKIILNGIINHLNLPQKDYEYLLLNIIDYNNNYFKLFTFYLYYLLNNNTSSSSKNKNLYIYTNNNQVFLTNKKQKEFQLLFKINNLGYLVENNFNVIYIENLNKNFIINKSYLYLLELNNNKRFEEFNKLPLNQQIKFENAIIYKNKCYDINELFDKYSNIINDNLIDFNNIKYFINDINIPLYTLLFHINKNSNYNIFLTYLLLIFYHKYLITNYNKNEIYITCNNIVYSNITKITHFDKSSFTIFNNDKEIILYLKDLSSIIFDLSFELKFLIDNFNLNNIYINKDEKIIIELYNFIYNKLIIFLKTKDNIFSLNNYTELNNYLSITNNKSYIKYLINSILYHFNIYNDNIALSISNIINYKFFNIYDNTIDIDIIIFYISYLYNILNQNNSSNKSSNISSLYINIDIDNKKFIYTNIKPDNYLFKLTDIFIIKYDLTDLVNKQKNIINKITYKPLLDYFSNNEFKKDKSIILNDYIYDKVFLNKILSKPDENNFNFYLKELYLLTLDTNISNELKSKINVFILKKIKSLNEINLNIDIQLLLLIDEFKSLENLIKILITKNNKFKNSKRLYFLSHLYLNHSLDDKIIKKIYSFLISFNFDDNSNIELYYNIFKIKYNENNYNDFLNYILKNDIFKPLIYKIYINYPKINTEYKKLILSNLYDNYSTLNISIFNKINLIIDYIHLFNINEYDFFKSFLLKKDIDIIVYNLYNNDIISKKTQKLLLNYLFKLVYNDEIKLEYNYIINIIYDYYTINSDKDKNIILKYIFNNIDKFINHKKIIDLLLLLTGKKLLDIIIFCINLYITQNLSNFNDFIIKINDDIIIKLIELYNNNYYNNNKKSNQLYFNIYRYNIDTDLYNYIIKYSEKPINNSEIIDICYQRNIFSDIDFYKPKLLLSTIIDKFEDNIHIDLFNFNTKIKTESQIKINNFIYDKKLLYFYVFMTYFSQFVKKPNLKEGYILDNIGNFKFYDPYFFEINDNELIKILYKIHDCDNIHDLLHNLYLLYKHNRLLVFYYFSLFYIINNRFKDNLIYKASKSIFFKTTQLSFNRNIPKNSIIYYLDTSYPLTAIVNSFHKVVVKFDIKANTKIDAYKFFDVNKNEDVDQFLILRVSSNNLQINSKKGFLNWFKKNKGGYNNLIRI